MPRSSIVLVLCFSCSVLVGQTSSQTQLQTILDRTAVIASLTVNGTPFHAEMKITGAKLEPQYEGAVSVDWVSPTKYRIEVRSADFHQVQTVDQSQFQEQTEGDFYPGWLHSFVTALLDPLAIKPLLLDPKASIGASQSSGNGSAQLCINRNDRPGGIRDDMTWSGVCLTSDGRMLNAYNFISWVDFSDHAGFNGKKVARGYSLSTGNYEKISGKLTSLRPLDAREIDAIHVTQTTPTDKRIGFAFISTKAEEARLELAKPFDWPPVREGKTEGYMIVRALTDVTGQVRETSKYNSDNPGLEEAGRQAAMGYKFKPMQVDGVPMQMEIPLVLHFKTTQGVPLPFLKGDEIGKVSRSCKNPVLLPEGMGERGRHYHVKVSVNEQGKQAGVTFPDGYPDFGFVLETVEECNFGIYTVDGKPSYYHVELEFIAAP